MYLRDIQLVPNGPGESKQQVLALRRATSHVEEIFRLELPKKFALHGQGKIVIELGNFRPQTNQYCEALGVGVYSLPSFELQAFLTRSPESQEIESLNIIESCLVDLATRFGADPGPLRDAAQRTRASGFSRKVRLKASKSHPSRRLRAEVILTYRRGGADVEVIVVNRAGEVLRSMSVLRDSWSYEIYHHCHAGMWNHETFVLLSSNGEARLKLNCSDVLGGA